MKQAIPLGPVPPRPVPCGAEARRQGRMRGMYGKRLFAAQLAGQLHNVPGGDAVHGQQAVIGGGHAELVLNAHPAEDGPAALGHHVYHPLILKFPL